MPILEREEYVEQAYLFRALLERLPEGMPIQELLDQLRQELLSTTKLPIAIDYLLTELKHTGVMSTAMQRLGHYFHPFQSYVIAEAEADRGRFDIHAALLLLQQEAEYRAKGGGPAGLFLYHFECLSRHRLKYDPGLLAVSQDPWFDRAWSEWILIVRRQVGFVDIADLIFVRSEYYLTRAKQLGEGVEEATHAVLFGEKEGKIAFANRRKDPLFLFAALQRHLGYPPVPKFKQTEDPEKMLIAIKQRLDRMEIRMKLVEEEQKGGIDLTKFYVSPDRKPEGDLP